MITGIFCFCFQIHVHSGAEACVVANHLFKVALHGFVRQQQDRPHQISHQDEIPFGLQVQGHDVVIVVALGPQFLLSRPLVQSHLEDTLIRNCLQPCRAAKGEVSAKASSSSLWWSCWHFCSLLLLVRIRWASVSVRQRSCHIIWAVNCTQGFTRSAPTHSW